MAEMEPVVIDEVVTLDTEETEVKFARAEFATVVFHDIAETYPEDAHIECGYTLTSDLVPTTRDYVALYRVGWMSPRDYIYYEWAPMPKEYKVGCDTDSHVMFPAHKLPKDDGEFYQFCYVSSSSQIRGASTPFQFRRIGADDFVEVEDEETNMLIIRSKTIYLEENLQQAQTQKQKLLETQEALQRERDSIITKYQEVKNRLVTMETEHKTMRSRLSSSEGTVEQLKRESRDMVMVRDELQKKIEMLTKERMTLNERIVTLTSDLAAANEKVKRLTEELAGKKGEMRKLQSEKDEISGKNAILEEQAEMFKKHAETTETTVDQYSKHSESLQIKLAQQESLIEHIRRNVNSLTFELEDNRENLDKQTTINLQDKDRVQLLGERLKNSEDKLMAVEESKLLLQKEITTFEVTQHELSRQIEKSKTECEILKKKVVTLEEDFTQKTQIQACEMEQTLDDVLTTVQEKEKLQKENSQLKQSLTMTLEGSDTSHRSMSIMRDCLSQIKDRLEKKEKQHKGLERLMRGREQDFLEHEREMRREIEDLKEKIYMCGEEYKNLYLEKSKLQRKVQRMSNKRKSKSEKCEKPAGTEPMVECELSQKSAQATLNAAESETSVSQDLIGEVEELEKALNKKLLKKEKYKKLYKEELDKSDEMRKKHVEEMQEKETENAKLKKRIRELPNDWDLKLRALEKFVTEKEMTIEELNQKLRLCNQGRNDETGASMSPPRSGAAPYMMYPGAYGHEAAPNPNVPYAPWLHIYPQQGQLQYPHSQLPGQLPRPPATIYPHPVDFPAQGAQQQGPPVPPRIRIPARTNETDQTGAGEDLTVLDSPDTESPTLETPMMPLPAPLEPEKLPSAKIAAVKSSAGHDEPDARFVDTFSSETDLKVKLPQGPSAPPPNIGDLTGLENREDRFYDAEGSSMKLCSECNMTFPADIDEQTLLEHQVSHMGIMCPQCKMLKPDNMSDDDFTRHVNKHYEDEENMQVF